MLNIKFINGSDTTFTNLIHGWIIYKDAIKIYTRGENVDKNYAMIPMTSILWYKEYESEEAKIEF